MLNGDNNHDTKTQEAFEAAHAASVLPDAQTGQEVHLWRTYLSHGFTAPNAQHDRFTHYSDLSALCEQAAKPPLNAKDNPIYSGRRTNLQSIAPDLHANLMRRPHPVFGTEQEGFDRLISRPKSFAEVREFLLQEWPTGAAKIQAELELLDAPQTASIKRKRVFGDQGDDVCSERFMHGAFDSMFVRRSKRNVLGFEKVRIIVDLGASCGLCDNIVCDMAPVEPEALFWRGGAAASLCDSLEAAGYRVEIIAGMAVRRVNSVRQTREAQNVSLLYDENNQKVYNHAGREVYKYAPIPHVQDNLVAVSFNVKDFDAPLNYGLVASATCHASVARRVILAEIAQQATYATDGGTLDTLKNPRVIQELNLETPETCTVYVEDWCLSAPMAQAWVRGTLYGLQYRRSGLNLDGSFDDEMTDDQE